MSFKAGVSQETISSNIKELLRSGKTKSEARAEALTKARKYKKMSDGGFVEGEDEEGEQSEREDETKVFSSIAEALESKSIYPKFDNEEEETEIESSPGETIEKSILPEAARLAIENRKKRRIF